MQGGKKGNNDKGHKKIEDVQFDKYISDTD